VEDGGVEAVAERGLLDLPEGAEEGVGDAGAGGEEEVSEGVGDGGDAREDVDGFAALLKFAAVADGEAGAVVVLVVMEDDGGGGGVEVFADGGEAVGGVVFPGVGGGVGEGSGGAGCEGPVGVGFAMLGRGEEFADVVKEAAEGEVEDVAGLAAGESAALVDEVAFELEAEEHAVDGDGGGVAEEGFVLAGEGGEAGDDGGGADDATHELFEEETVAFEEPAAGGVGEEVGGGDALTEELAEGVSEGVDEAMLGRGEVGGGEVVEEMEFGFFDPEVVDALVVHGEEEGDGEICAGGGEGGGGLSWGGDGTAEPHAGAGFADDDATHGDLLGAARGGVGGDRKRGARRTVRLGQRSGKNSWEQGLCAGRMGNWRISGRGDGQDLVKGVMGSGIVFFY
jgi:hypothetical protein